MAYRILNAESVWKGDENALRAFAAALCGDCAARYDVFRAAYGWNRAAIDRAIYDARAHIAAHIADMRQDVRELCDNLETRARGNALRETMERAKDILFSVTRPSFS